MYSLNNIDETALAITTYVKTCMKEKKLGSFEIKEYEKAVKRCSFSELIELSQEYIDMLNNMNNQECEVSYL
jgi:hypothetical protein